MTGVFLPRCAIYLGVFLVTLDAKLKQHDVGVIRVSLLNADDVQTLLAVIAFLIDASKVCV